MIGGGLAGLSSAVALAEAGFRVRLFEKRPHLGGRATSYTLPDGSEVDNCQHVTLGCCTNLSDFYRRVGASEKIRFYDRLYFVDKKGRRSAIEASALIPPPLHMAPSFLFFSALTMADKAAIARAMMAIARSGGRPPGLDSLSMWDWLRRVGQTPAAIERFWRVVLVSALDEELSKTSAQYGVDVFWKAFLGSRGGYRVGIPTVPLAELYEGCKVAIEQKGGEVRQRAGVREICVENNSFRGVAMEDGSRISADACVAAVPHDKLLEMAPQACTGAGSALMRVHELKTSPITGVHFWFDRKVMDEPFLTLLDHTTQWIFNKSFLSAAAPDFETKTNGARPIQEQGIQPRTEGQHLQLVISASYDLVPRSRQEIIELCRCELGEVLPATREAKLEKATVIKEVSATFSPEPGVDALRPPQDIGVNGFALAGDWTQTGWPATMEGAVRSGYLAAESLLRSMGQPRKFLQPDLPFEGLSKFWAARMKASNP